MQNIPINIIYQIRRKKILVFIYSQKIETYMKKYIYSQNMLATKRKKFNSSETELINLNW